ncbi:MAG: polysaccharide deacetylase family protein [Pedobacter sp.]|nr:MAG: polysaccharide deacetylase family protein [Pedobacter sp.]
MKNICLISVLASTLFLFSCQSNSSLENTQTSDSTGVSAASDIKNDESEKVVSQPSSNTSSYDAIKVADAKTILARKQVPILCYHQVRNWLARDGKAGKDYIVEIENFKNHIKMLADSGYNTILPDQLYAYLNEGKPLPEKPIMLTFDDTGLDQFTVVNPTLKKYGYKGVYFIMTVSIGKKGKFVDYMSAEQIKQLSDEGNVIGSHSYDHKNFKKYEGNDWVEQLEKPTQKLEEITGKKITEFAYPFGLWNAQGIPELKKRNFRMAFGLADKRDENEPLYTIRRIIASGYWSPKTLHNSIVKSF